MVHSRRLRRCSAARDTTIIKYCNKINHIKRRFKIIVFENEGSSSPNFLKSCSHGVKHNGSHIKAGIVRDVF